MRATRRALEHSRPEAEFKHTTRTQLHMHVISLVSLVEKHYVIHVNKSCCSVKVKVKLLMPNDIYMSYRTANLQTLHFIYLVNKYTY
jgi:hypothetical protein